VSSKTIHNDNRIRSARKQNKCITIEDEHAIILQYNVNGGSSQYSFTTVHDEESSQMREVGITRIMLVVPQFTLFVTGDLAFYAYSLVDHISCSFW
jgi:hypothetical protein